MFKRISSLPVHSPLRRHTLRHLTEKATQKSGKIGWEDVSSDPRPPWVYSTSAGLRLILIPSEYFDHREWLAGRSSNLEEAFYFTPYFLQTLETGNMSLCLYVIIPTCCAN